MLSEVRDNRQFSALNAGLATLVAVLRERGVGADIHRPLS